MSNVVSFSGRDIDLNLVHMTEVQGMTMERQRELLMGSSLGQSVLFAAPPMPPMQPPAPPSPPQQKAPHVAIHVHAPGGQPDQSPMGGPPGGMPPPMPGDPSMMPPMDEQPAEEDKTPQIEAFLQTLPPEITIEDLQQYFENMEPVDDEAGDDEMEPPAKGKGKPPQFSITALEMFKN